MGGGEGLPRWGPAGLPHSENAGDVQGRGGAGRGGPGRTGLSQCRLGPPTRAPLCPLQDLKTVLSLPQHPGEFLHPVVYACTAVMLLCLLASVVTYLVHQR